MGTFNSPRHHSLYGEEARYSKLSTFNKSDEGEPSAL